MSSFDSLVKDKRSLVYEILFSLEGIVGDLISFDGNPHTKDLQLNDFSIDSTISLSEINLINQLLKIANHYNRINHFVEKYSSDSNSYIRRLAQTIDELLNDYRNDLIEVEKDINRHSNYSLMKFNKLFKYCQTLEFLSEMVSQFNEQMNCCVSVIDLIDKSLISGFTQIQKTSKIIQGSYDCLYSDIWSWILFGYLTKRSQNNFFIKENDSKQIELIVSRIPGSMNTSDAFKIFKIGENVRWYESRAVESLFSDKNNDIFECLRRFKREQFVDKTIFKDILELSRKIVSEQTWNYVINEQPFKEAFTRIKAIYLTSSDNFWCNFVSQTSISPSNGHKYSQKEIEKTFHLSLRHVFSENIVNHLLSDLSIIIPKNGNKLSFFVDYEIPVALQNIISKDSLNKYNEIMNFMAKLYSSRHQLDQIWLNAIKTKAVNSSNLRLKVLILRHSLSFMINTFYNFFKIDVIERLYSQFLDKIEGTKDIEDIQKEHLILLTQIISQMFLKTPVINRCFEQLFLHSNQFKHCLESEESLNRLIEEFERTKGQTYHLLINMETYKTNKMISNLVLEIEKCSKQQILLN